jgi:hypothetical protein
MKKTGFIFVILAVLASFSGTTWADCDGPFQTCMNICRQTTKEDSPEASTCANRCFHGVSGCQKRCAGANKQSGSVNEFAGSHLMAAATCRNLSTSIGESASCIEQDLTCILNGTPCCPPYTCKGKFPNTTCQ